MKKIDLILHQESQYQALDYFTYRLKEALDRQGVKTQIRKLSPDDPTGFLAEIQYDRPDVTLSFNGLLPDAKGRFLCDLLEIPHIACLVDSPAWFIPLKESPLSYATCIDRSYLDFFHGLGYDRTAFMTQACDIKLFDTKVTDADKCYDITMLASSIDLDEIETIWQRDYPPSMQRALAHAVDITLRDPKVSFWQAFSEAVGIHHAEENIDFNEIITLLKLLERYVNGKERLDFLRNMTGITIDLFGDTQGKGSWSHYLKGLPHIRLHPPVSFEAHLEILRKSRITLNNIAKMRQGGSERVFNAFALNTLPISSESPYLEEFYTEGESILFSRWGSWKKNTDKIQSALNDKAYYNTLLEKGRALTKTHHTWDNRAKDLIAFK